MSEHLRRTWAEVHLDRLDYNVNEIKRRIPAGCEMMGIIKADAYGHGDEQIARRLVALGVTWFGVSNLGEALRLRRLGFENDILILGDTPARHAGVLAANSITQAVYGPDYAAALGNAAAQSGVRVKAHIKVDTGMGRIGFNSFRGAPDAAGEIAAAANLPGIEVTGIFTHFSCADELSEDAEAYTRAQYQRFVGVCDALAALGVSLRHRHCCNSAGIMRYPEFSLDMVRPGIILYGISPSAELAPQSPFLPVMELKSTVSLVKTVDDGRAVSYGRTHRTSGERTLATVCLGYADGYARTLSGKGRMLVKGCFAPQVGRVCMDQLVLDVTDIPGVTTGDVVTVFGRDGEAVLPVEELAAKIGSIGYEIVCLITRRVLRVYLYDGQETAVLDYLDAPLP